MTVIAAAPTRPVSWVFDPDCSATAVREPLVLTGNPWNSPAATLAAPMPIISWFARTSWPLRAANADAVEIVSVSDTSAMPSAPATRSHRSEADTFGMVKGGKPWGSTPTSETPRSARLEDGRRCDRQQHGHEDGGDLGQPPLQQQDDGEPATPMASAAVTVSPLATPSMKPTSSAIRPFASTEKPNSFGSCPTTIVRARPFM